MTDAQKHPYRKRFVLRLLRSLFIAIVFIVSSLFIGMCGYHHFEKMSWLDAYVNAAMILSGMGPIIPPNSDAGKLFEGTYALFSGIIFLVSIAIILAPFLHRFLLKFHIEELKDLERK